MLLFKQESIASFKFTAMWIFILTMVWSSTYAQGTNHNIHKLSDPYDKLGGRFDAKQALLEDSLGYLWIATSKGLCKYSGSGIDCLTHDPNDPSSIDGNEVMYLSMDSEHLIWASFKNNGVNAFDINGKKIYALSFQGEQKNALLHNRVWATWEDEDGYIWISYFYGGISRFDKRDRSIIHYSIDNEVDLKDHRPRTVVSVLTHDKEAHTYWLATTVGLVKFNTRTQEHSAYMFEGEIDIETSESQFNRSILKPLWARSMCRDVNGDLWIGTFGGLIHFDSEKETYKILRNVNGSILNNVSGVMSYDDKHIMLSYKGGLALMDIYSYEMLKLDEAEGYGPNNDLFARMYKAKNGFTYILNRGGKKTGIYKYSDVSDMFNNNQTGNYVTDILVSENYLHYHRRPGKIESRHLESGERLTHTFDNKEGSTIRVIFSISGDSILVGDFYHMYKFHPLQGLEKIADLSQENVYRHESVFVDSDGEIWNGRQRDGVFRMSLDGTVIHYNHKSYPSLVYQDYILDFLEDEHGDIWIATEQGWTIFNKEKNTTKNYLAKDVSIGQDVNIRSINALAQTENGQIWIGGGSSGLSLWDKETEVFVQHVNTSSGLRSNIVYDIAKDADNNLWLATGAGLSWVNSKTYDVKNFGSEYGVNTRTFSLSFDRNILYAGHPKGYYKVNIDSLLSHERTPAIPVIKGFELYNKRLDSLLHKEYGIELPHDQNFFSFEYGSINYFDPHLEQYQYRLTGIDQDWVSDRGERKAGYTNIDHGNYTFQVRVKTEADNWSAPVSIDVQICPAWYQAWWFYLLLFLISALIVWGAIRSYVLRKQKELDIERRFAQLETMVLKSQMNPHFIFNSLNSIRYLFMKDEKENGLKYITKFAKLLRSTLNHGDHALVRLEDEVELTELYIQLEQLRFDNTFTFSYKYDIDPSWKEILIPPFVIQPIVENAFWHGLQPLKSKEKKLDITVIRVESSYRIIIEDNGVGLHVKSEHTKNQELNKNKSYGLNIIGERFELMNKNEKLNYHIEVKESESYNTGTMVIITII